MSKKSLIFLNIHHAKYFFNQKLSQNHQTHVPQVQTLKKLGVKKDKNTLKIRTSTSRFQGIFVKITAKNNNKIKILQHINPFSSYL